MLNKILIFAFFFNAVNCVGEEEVNQQNMNPSQVCSVPVAQVMNTQSELFDPYNPGADRELHCILQVLAALRQNNS